MDRDDVGSGFSAFNPNVAALPPYNAGLALAVARRISGRQDVARLASNENPLGCSPAVLEVLRAGAYEPWRYADPHCTELRAALGEKLGVATGRLVIGNGSEEMIAAICRGVLVPGSRVLTVTPSFGLHEIEPLAAGAEVVKVPMTASMGFDLPALEAELAAGPRLTFIGSPWNPVGPVLGHAELARLAAAVPPGTLFVLDEAYFEFAGDSAPDGLAVLAESGIPYVVLRTFSKVYGLAGLRVGYAIAADETIARVIAAAKTPFNVNAAAQAAALAALGDEAWMRDAVARIAAERERMADALRRLGHAPAESRTNFLFFDCGENSRAVAERMLARGVIVKAWQEPGWERFLRVTIGSAEENDRFLQVLAGANASPPAPRPAVPEVVLAELRAALGGARVLTGADVEALDPGWDPANLRAGVLVQPGTTPEVSAVLRICRAHGLSVVPQGGRTGLVGGSRSAPGQVVLSLARMNRIDLVDPVERVAVAEAGVTLQALQEAAAAHGLEPGIDLAARGSATLGGLVSTNAGGIMAFRYGVMRHQVLGLEAVLEDGTVLHDLGRVVKNNAGYDVKQLFIGGEGTLGVVTRVALKLWPTRPASASVLFGIPAIEAAFAAISEALSADGAALRAAEVMWPHFFATTAAANGFADAGLDMASPLFLLIGLDGIEPGRVRAAAEALFATIAGQFPGTTGLLAESRRQEAALWRLREDTEALYRLHPAAPSHDVSVPLSAIPAYVARIRAELSALDPGLDPFIFGHLADGNVHVVLNRAGALVPDDLAAAIETVLYRGLHAGGGSFSAEHGIGAKRLAPLALHADAAKLALMRAVKQALDPRNVLNPGKVVALPTRAVQGTTDYV